MYKSSKREAQHDEKPRITTLFLVLHWDETVKYSLGQRWASQENAYRASQNTLSCGRSEGLTRLRTGSLRGKTVTKREGSKCLDGICLAGHKKIHDWSEPREGLSDNGKGAPLFLPNPPLGSPFFFARLPRYSSFFFDKQPSPRLSFKVPTVRFGCITLRSSTVETRKLLFSYRHNQSPQLQENYRL